MKISSAKDLSVYQKAYSLTMDIFRLSKTWPSEERYALTGQIRRSSRAVCANLREAWAKRRYEAHFVAKLTDCDGENSETDTWLDCAKDCGYLDAEQHYRFVEQVHSIGRMLGSMLSDPGPFLVPCERKSSPALRSRIVRGTRRSLDIERGNDSLPDLRPPTSDF